MKSENKINGLGKKFVKVLMSGLCICLVLNVVWPDKEKSMTENRMLARFPALSASFLQDLDVYFSDQFAGRDLLFKGSYIIKRMEGIRRIDDVYLGKGALIRESSPYDKTIVSKNMDALNAFRVAHDVNTMLMVVPTAASIEKDRLPAFAPVGPEDLDAIWGKSDEGITNIDVRQALNKHKEETIYYKTDHHWTSLGAWYAYQVLAGSQGYTPAGNTVYEVSDHFQGTLASKTGSPFLKDTIELYVPDNVPEYVVTYGSDQHKSRTMYNSKAIHEKDQYEVFLGANEGIVRIESDNDSDKHLLLLKDSYANTMLQFLIPQYRTITIVDPRYYYEDLERIMRSDLITDVLVLYNYSNFVSDSSLSDVLQSRSEEQ